MVFKTSSAWNFKLWYRTYRNQCPGRERLEARCDTPKHSVCTNYEGVPSWSVWLERNRNLHLDDFIWGWVPLVLLGGNKLMQSRNFLGHFVRKVCNFCQNCTDPKVPFEYCPAVYFTECTVWKSANTLLKLIQSRILEFCSRLPPPASCSIKKVDRDDSGEDTRSTILLCLKSPFHCHLSWLIGHSACANITVIHIHLCFIVLFSLLLRFFSESRLDILLLKTTWVINYPWKCAACASDLVKILAIL